MNVSIDRAIALPARLRPTPEQVCSWYERALVSSGADVQRVAPNQLEFTLPLSRAFLDSRLLTSLAPVSSGELAGTDTSDGFEVSVRATTRTWVSILLIAVFGAATGGLAFMVSPARYLPAVAGIALLGFAWLRTRAALGHFLATTNDAIADSFAAVPPIDARSPDMTRVTR